MKTKTLVTTAMAFGYIERYIGPIGDYNKIELEIELDKVIRLVDPKFPEEWQWDINEAELTELIKAHLVGEPVPGFVHTTEVSVDQWDCDLGDDYTSGYLITLKAEIREVAST